MGLEKEKKKKLISEYQIHSIDTGSSEVQISLFTERISNLTSHMKTFKKDFQARRALIRLVNKRRRLLLYLRKKSGDRYTILIERLGIRK
ncbi:TPA: 30S ribosomal protein S15 [bacterium]|nr:30S ribosomal protein S15 [bacterium]